MSRDELIEGVRILMTGGLDSEVATDELLARCEEQVTGGLSDLIFWPKEELTAEQIVDRALRHRAIEL